MSRLIARLLLLLLLFFCATGLARTVAACDTVVLDWNAVACAATEEDPVQGNPTFGSRALAMVHAAIFDAVNAIIPEREPYALDSSYCPPEGASPEAAASQAAYRVLVYLFPDQQALFAAELKWQLAQVDSDRARRRGVQVGNAAADAIIQLRANDGAYVTAPYHPRYIPGWYRPTPPNYNTAWWPQWGDVTPFVMERGDQFRPGPPPALDSAEYTAAFKEVKRIGRLNSSVRTQEQTDIADFWSYDQAPATPPPVELNEILDVIAFLQQNKLAQNAYLFAIVNLGIADAAISAWDAKYYYHFWRPVTAIRKAGQDGNPATVADPNWWPLGWPEARKWTPDFPSYVSGHATFGGTFFRLLQLYYETDDITFTFESRDLPGQPRTFTSFSQADQELVDARVYMGVHWRFDDTVGDAMGHKIAEYAFTHALLPK